MSYVKILVHLVFTTKEREPFLSPTVRPLLFKHIKEYSKLNNIYLESIGGWNEHVHVLVSLGKEQTISKVAMLIKGESSYWMNKSKMLDVHFNWQDDYYAISIGESGRGNLISYISNQEKHHKGQSYLQEIREIISKYKLKDTPI